MPATKKPAEKLFHFTTLSDQIARARAGNVTQWLIDSVMVRNGSTLLYAPPGSGKTLVAMDLALSASTGRPWLGVYEIGEPIRVLYLDDDGNNDHEFNTRLLSFGAQEANKNLHCLLHNNFILTDDVSRRTLIRWCQEEGVKLIIIDSLTRIHRLAESNSGDMKTVNACVKELCQAGMTVMMLHHATKSGRTFRGSSEIPTAYDNVFSLEKSASDLFTLRNEKVRSVSARGVWEGCDIAVLTDDEGRLVLDGSLPPSGGSQADEEDLRERVLDLLSGDDMHTSAIAKALKLSSRRYSDLEACLEALMAEETITSYRKGKATIYHREGADDEGDEYAE